MSRSDDQRVADILDACDELEGVVSLRSEGQVPDEVLLRASESCWPTTTTASIPT